MRLRRPGALISKHRRGALLFTCALAGFGLAYAAYETRLAWSLELSTVDARFAIRGPRSPRYDTVFVGADARTFDNLAQGRQIPRRYQAQVIDRISRDRPRLVLYDFTFDTWTSARDDNALYRSLVAASRRGTRIAFAVKGVRDDGKPQILGVTQGFPRTIGGRSGDAYLPGDPGDVKRRILYAPFGLKALPIQAAEMVLRQRISPNALGTRGAWIDYFGRLRPVSFCNLVRHGRCQPRIPEGFFRNKIVVIGTADPGDDLHPTSFSSELMFGAEVQVNALDTALRGFPLRSVSGWPNLLLIAFLSLVAPLLSLRLRLVPALVGTALAGGALTVAAQLAFDAGWIVAFIYPLAGLVTSALTVLAVRYAFAIADVRLARKELVGHLPLGADLAGYRTERLLGRGGGGVVYLATEVASRRKAALKVMNPDLAEDRDFRRRFLREAELTAAVDHPHVIPIYASGEQDGRLFFAMKWVRGSLAGLLRRDGAIDVNRGLTIVQQVADALDTAHAVGLVHRDVTPSNILLDPPRSSGSPDHAYLADFGLTVHQTEMSALDRVGKPDYVAPEQIRGDSIDGRADQYSLACVLYECLVGEAPFASDSEIGVLGGHLTREAPPAHERRSDLPPELSFAIARALMKSPRERYPNCGYFVEAARAAVDAAARLADVDVPEASPGLQL